MQMSILEITMRVFYTWVSKGRTIWDITDIRSRYGGYYTFHGCYIATCVYGSYDCPQVWVLRRFRDQYLQKALLGRLFIRSYYFISPKLVSVFGNEAWFHNASKKVLDRIVCILENKGFSSSPYIDEV